MTDLLQLSYLKQRNIEQFFAASIFMRPTETIEQCGWLDPADLTHEGIREYWTIAKQRISPGMDEHQAAEIATQAAFECGIHLDCMQWSGDLGYMIVPQAYASEISRKQYLIRLARLSNKLAIAIGDQNDQEARIIVEEMESQKRAGTMTIPHALDVADKFEAIVREGKRSVDTFIPPIDLAISTY